MTIAQTEVPSCAYAAETTGSCTYMQSEEQPKGAPSLGNAPGRASTSATIGAYASYIGNLHRNTYAAYIRLHELEKVWGLWNYVSPTKTMPFEPVETTPAPVQPVTLSPASGPLYRLTPALSSFEITLRLLLEFMDINVGATVDETAPRIRRHRPYVNHASRVDAVMRNLSAQLLMLRTVIDMDMGPGVDVKTAYDLTTDVSTESLARGEAWWWRDAAPNASFPPHQLHQRISGLVQCHFAGLPFGPGLSAKDSGLQLPYDKLVLPRHTREHCVQDEDDEQFVEDHFFATVHQITEAWCCVMERQLDVAQWDLDHLDLSATADEAANNAALSRVARRYRFACQIWEYLIDHISMLSEMDSADYLTLKLHLHGASGGQSVRLRQLGRRIAHLMPLVPTCLAEYTGPESAATDPSALVDMLRVLAQVRSEKPEDEQADKHDLVRTLQMMFAAHTAPAAQCIQIVQAIQMLENAVRRFYFGHQHLAIMVLGAGAAGTQELTVKMLERGWKDANRYLSCEHAKEQLSVDLDAAQLARSKAYKGRIIKTLSDSARARHGAAKQHPQWQQMMCPMTAMVAEAPIRASDASSVRHTSPFRPYFERSLALQDPHTLHFSTYGMGLAPDVAFESVAATHRLLASTLNESWDIIFGQDLPLAAQYILASLGLPSAAYHVNFGSNCHEFLIRLLSCHASTKRLRVLTSDAEFLSFTRQMHALPHHVVDQVALEPFATYGDRLAAAAATGAYDIVYASVVYSNFQFRLPDDKIAAVAAALPATSMFILDVAQTLENVPLALPGSYPNVFVIGSGIKHATAGPGLGFVAFPSAAKMTPAITGWIADLSVLEPTHVPTTDVGYTPELALQGGTPGFHYALRQWNDVQAFYKSHGWSLAKRHAYVLDLQRHFFVRLGSAFSAGSTNRAAQDPATISNAFVLSHSSAPFIHSYLTTPTMRPASSVSQRTFHCDVRKKTSLRLGFGIQHVTADVLALADILVEAHAALKTSEPLMLVV
ncbi:selenocysteine lyase [Achlya hypogyna]|uniref:Selenocysteine lyase n=1 Tax=Achlya hypogyna TaxID=1202772 RepID=A0A1V9ZA22_ACHHY|nr:selenocysteine lyase [Achlya hypogyna]